MLLATVALVLLTAAVVFERRRRTVRAGAWEFGPTTELPVVAPVFTPPPARVTAPDPLAEDIEADDRLAEDLDLALLGALSRPRSMGAARSRRGVVTQSGGSTLASTRARQRWLSSSRGRFARPARPVRSRPRPRKPPTRSSALGWRARAGSVLTVASGGSSQRSSVGTSPLRRSRLPSPSPRPRCASPTT